MQTSASQSLEIQHESDVSRARQAGKITAGGLGFEPEVCEEIALVMIELATNLLKHARGGSLTLTPLGAGGRVGLEIESRDSGPGIDDIEQALADRFSTAGSRGTGLGAVNRLMDEMEITSRRGSGTRIVSRKWVRAHQPSGRICPLAVGVATRPCGGCTLNGDAFVIKRWSENLLVGIIDGLGHGPFAHRAALTATNYVTSHFDQPLDQIFRGTGRACRATRGVVMALARFDWGQGQMTFAAVGNIEVRVFPGSPSFNVTMRRGIVGLNAPNPVVSEHSWSPDRLFVLHSDGVRTHWDWKEFPALADQPPAAIAQELLRCLAKENDDATVLAVRSAGP